MEWDNSFDAYWLAEPGHPDSGNTTDGEALGLAKHKETGEIRWGIDDYHFCWDPQCSYGPFSHYSFKWNRYLLIDSTFWQTLEKYDPTSEDDSYDFEEFNALLKELKEKL